VEENGGKLLMKTRVASINVTEGTVTGITTEKGEVYSAPIVISNAGIRQTVLKLVGEQYFEKEYVNTIKALENNLACAGYRYFLNAPVLKHPMIVYYPEGCAVKMEEFERMAKGESKPKHNYIYIGSTSLYPNMSPHGKQVAYVCMSCLADPKADIRPYLDYVEERAKKIVPELFDHIERREIMAPAHVPAVGNDIILEGQGGEAYGIALSVGQSGDKQPKGDTSIKGLYIVGNDSAGSGLGTHQAVDSGFKVADLVKRGSSNLY
jgi:phytoene dehydrogenase-like protein